jgi:hypothetical protein
VVAVCTPGVSDSHHAPGFYHVFTLGYKNEVMKMRPRPTPGETTERELSVDVCGECGYAIDMSMCDYDCKYDGDTNRPVIIRARYKRTDVFLGDKIVNQEPIVDEDAPV